MLRNHSSFRIPAGKLWPPMAKAHPARLLRWVPAMAATMSLILVIQFLAHLALGSREAGTLSQDHFYKSDLSSLYLLDKLSKVDPAYMAFGEKIISISQHLDIEPDWLMAVIYSESSFHPRIQNQQGSGAMGLIQFMPATLKELGTDQHTLRSMRSVEQLEVVQRYLEIVRERYGPYDSLTDLYLAILYPKARKKGLYYCIHHAPMRSYKQNAGLDIDKDGRIMVWDIEAGLKRKFPELFEIQTKKAP